MGGGALLNDFRRAPVVAVGDNTWAYSTKATRQLGFAKTDNGPERGAGCLGKRDALRRRESALSQCIHTYTCVYIYIYSVQGRSVFADEGCAGMKLIINDILLSASYGKQHGCISTAG